MAINFESLRDRWDSLPSLQKTKFTKLATGAAVIVLCLIAYAIRDDKKEIRVVKEDKRELDIGKGMLEDDVRSTVNKAVENFATSDKDKERRLQALETIAEGLKNGPKEGSTDLVENLQPAAVPEGKPKYPEPPSYASQGTPAAGFGASAMPVAEPPKPEIVGEIGSVAGTSSNKADDTKKKNTVYLPPSFMEGMVLTGIEADAGENAKSEPEPIMIRVEAPAQLPNELKANLKGCFVVANAIGKLNKERVDPRLVSLNCLLTNGDAVIDQPVKGMVVDADGKKGLAGIVVSKSGTLAARAVMASAFGGIAESVAIGNTTTSISPLGTTQAIDTDKSLETAMGHGLRGGATELQKIYIDLIKQTTPVIEMGAGKKCTVVITEGVQLEIKSTRPNV